jgi:hypothetical protein
MIDRFGNDVRVSFTEVEDVWIAAAATLPKLERLAALVDIAAMTGHRYHRIYDRMLKLRTLAPAPMPIKTATLVPVIPPIRPPSRERLMAGR